MATRFGPPVAVVAVLALAAPLTVLGQGRKSFPQHLHPGTPVHIVVDISSSQDPECRLDSRLMRAEAELQLSRAGVPVTETLDELPVVLEIDIVGLALPGQRGTVCVASAGIDVFKVAFVDQLPALVVVYSHRGIFSSPRQQHQTRMRQAVNELSMLFTAELLKARR